MENSQVACVLFPNEIVETISRGHDSAGQNSPMLEPSLPMPAEQEKSVVQRCLEGDEQAWDKLLRDHRKLIYAIAARFGARPEDCADIYQSVSIELFNGLSRVLKQQSIRSWVITVTVRQAFRWRKNCSQHMPLDEMKAEPEYILDLPESLWKCQQQEFVRRGIEQLPPRSAEMLRMLFFEQPPLPYQEVARRLGLATGSIGFIRGRALRKLREILDQSGCNRS